MFCPNCRAEFQEGFTKCSDCELDLVDDLPDEPEAEYIDSVIVFEGNTSSAAVINAALEEAGIESWVNDEGLTSVFPSMGSTTVEVYAQDEDAAMEIIDAMELDAEALEEDEEAGEDEKE